MILKLNDVIELELGDRIQKFIIDSYTFNPFSNYCNMILVPTGSPNVPEATQDKSPRNEGSHLIQEVPPNIWYG